MIRHTMARKVYLLLDNVRSAFNVGSMLRTAEGLGVNEVIICGITPYPKLAANDVRPPYLANNITKRIAKTALGAERTQKWRYSHDGILALKALKKNGVTVVALEQDKHAVPLIDYHPKGDVVLIVGNEIDGVNPDYILISDAIVEIPMSGVKESFNVSAAAAMALFYLTLML